MMITCVTPIINSILAKDERLSIWKSAPVRWCISPSIWSKARSTHKRKLHENKKISVHPGDAPLVHYLDALKIKIPNASVHKCLFKNIFACMNSLKRPMWEAGGMRQEGRFTKEEKERGKQLPPGSMVPGELSQSPSTAAILPWIFVIFIIRHKEGLHNKTWPQPCTECLLPVKWGAGWLGSGAIRKPLSLIAIPSSSRPFAPSGTGWGGFC